MGRRESAQRKQFFYKLSYLILILIILFIVIKSFSSSLFFKRPDRLNLLFYSQATRFYSISFTDNVNYQVYFYPDLKLLVPGGYQDYRVGALGKLAKLEKRQDLFKTTFSLATSTFLNLYFYPVGDEIFFGEKTRDEIIFPSPKEIFLNKSNASLLDRVFLAFKFMLLKKADFISITDYKIKKATGEPIFLDEDFAKKYQGFFYRKTYRTEKRNVQILYSKSGKDASLISQILEGNGIRVVDLTYSEKADDRCLVVEQAKDLSETAKDLSSFFGCQLMKGKTTISDIILKLGEKEEEWARE